MIFEIALFSVFATLLLVVAVYRLSTNKAKYFRERNLKYIGLTQSMKSIYRLLTGKVTVIQLIEESNILYGNDGILGAFDISNVFAYSYVVRDPEIIKRITVKAFNHFVDHRSVLDARTNPILANTLPSLQGEKWHEMRNTFSPAFTGSKIRQMFVLVTECAEEVVHHFLEKAKTSERIDIEMKDFIRRYTNDVIATCAFGIKVNSFTDPDNEFYLNGRKMVTPGGPLTILKNIFIVLLPKVAQALNLKLLDDTVGGTFKSIILDTMKTRKQNNIYRPDMINILMEVRERIQTENVSTDVSEFPTSKINSTREWSDDELVAQAFVFFTAGLEVTAQMLTFVAYELVVNSDIQQKLYEEVSGMNEQLNGKQISYEEIHKMKYLDQIVNETLRKWPPVVHTDRVCVRDYVYDDGNSKIIIEKGSHMSFGIMAMQKDPKYFPDPNKFDPDRFSDDNKHKIVSCSYLPFGIGPRNCIGSRFALMESKAILYYLLLNFSFEANKDSEIPLDLSILKPLEFHLELKPRIPK